MRRREKVRRDSNNDKIKATYEANKAMEGTGFEAYSAVRAGQVYHNLTNESVFGRALRDGKTILWGGANHVKIHSSGSETDFLRLEGWRLAHEFGPTKGQVFSVKAVNFQYSVPPSYYQSNTYERATEGFVHLVNLYKKDLPAYAPNQYRTIGELTDFAALFVPSDLTATNQAVYVSRSSINESARLQPELKQDAVWREFAAHDAVIAIPHSTLFDYSH